VADALSKTAQCLDDALVDGKDSLEIIHGIGEGKVRDAVHDYLKGLSVVRHFALDPLNPGVTKVYL
jgi:DNA mismatch repair protein MutS2